MNKFFSKVTNVNKNFSALINGLSEVKSNVEELNVLLNGSNKDLFNKAPTKLRNILATFSKVSDNVVDAAVEASELECNAEDKDALKRKSRLAAKQFNNAKKNFQEIKGNVTTALDLATDIKETFTDAVPEKVESAVTGTGKDIEKTPITAPAEPASKPESTVPAAEPQAKEALTFSKIDYFKDVVKKVISNFADLADDAVVATDVLVDIADVKPEDKPAAEPAEDETKNLKLAEEKLDDAVKSIEGEVEKVADPELKAFAKNKLDEVRNMKVTNFAEAEAKTNALTELKEKLTKTDDTCPECGKSPCECEAKLKEFDEKSEDALERLEDKVEEVKDPEVKSFAKQEIRKIRRMHVCNFSEAKAKTEAIEKLDKDIDEKSEAENLDKADEKIETAIDRVEDKVEKLEDAELKSFSKKELRRIRRMTVKNFAEAEAKTEALEELDKKVDGKTEEPAPANEEQNIDQAIEKLEDAIDRVEDKIDALPEGEVKTFCKTELRKVRKMRVKSFADAEAKTDALTEIESKMDKPADDQKPAEGNPDEIKEVTDKIESTISELETKVDNLKNEEIKNFAKSKLAEVRNMKVTNFAEADAKTAAVEKVSDEISDKVKIDSAESQITMDKNNEVNTKEFSEDEKAKVAACLDKVAGVVEKLEAKCTDETVKAFCKSVRELANTECKNMAEAVSKLDKLKECAEKLNACNKAKNLAEEPQKPANEPTNDNKPAEEPKKNDKPAEEPAAKPAEEPKKEEPKPEDNKPVETQDNPEPKIDDKEAALANFSQKNSGEQSYGDRLTRISGATEWN